MTSWDWVLVSGFLRLLILLAPFLGVTKDFALKNKQEAQEFANTSACKGMLFALPFTLMVSVMAEADRVCSGSVKPLVAVILFIVAAIVGYVFYLIPSWLFRGTVNAFLAFLLLTAAEVISQIFLIGPIANQLCNVAASTPAGKVSQAVVPPIATYLQTLA